MPNKKELNINELNKVSGGDENTEKYGFEYELEDHVEKLMLGYTVGCKVIARGYKISFNGITTLYYYLLPDNPKHNQMHRGWYTGDVETVSSLTPSSGVTKVDGK